jgi:hypothetical protein
MIADEARLTQMAKKARAKRRGRQATTGKGTLISLRCHQPFLQAVDGWREKQEDNPTRPAAIARLAELGLLVSRPPRRTSRHAASIASAMAGEEIDRLSDHSVPVEERDSRKRSLITGPQEFREIRKDHPNKSKI